MGTEAVADLAGEPTPPTVVVLERGPVSNFATAVTDGNPVYHDPDAAEAAGFDGIPVPPTYPIAWEHFGAFPELQPPGGTTSPVTRALRALMEAGGLILHGEQELTYHRLPVVGERLRSEGRIADVYEKEGGGSRMTFVVAETGWFDEAGEKVVTTRMTLLHRT